MHWQLQVAVVVAVKVALGHDIFTGPSRIHGSQPMITPQTPHSNHHVVEGKGGMHQLISAPTGTPPTHSMRAPPARISRGRPLEEYCNGCKFPMNCYIQGHMYAFCSGAEIDCEEPKH